MPQPVAVVTGSSRGIGRAIALKLAVEGYSVVINYLSQSEQAEELRLEISKLNGTAITVAADVSNSQEATRLIDVAVQEFGSIDLLVNNAGINRDQLILRMSDEDWTNILNTNLNAAFYCSRAALKHMVRKKSGNLIHISSVVGMSGNAGQSHYAAAKAALLGFSASIAKEYGMRGIRSNVIAPGFIQSDMTEALSPAMKQQIFSGISLGRFGTPEDVAEVVAFIASERAAYITGQSLRIDGGLTL